MGPTSSPLPRPRRNNKPALIAGADVAWPYDGVARCSSCPSGRGRRFAFDSVAEPAFDVAPRHGPQRRLLVVGFASANSKLRSISCCLKEYSLVRCVLGRIHRKNAEVYAAQQPGTVRLDSEGRIKRASMNAAAVAGSLRVQRILDRGAPSARHPDPLSPPPAEPRKDLTRLPFQHERPDPHELMAFGHPHKVHPSRRLEP